MLSPLPPAFALLLLSWAVSGAAAQHARELVLASRASQQAELDSVRDGVFQFSSATTESELSADEVVRWGMLTPRAARPTAVLRDGSTIVAAPVWTRSGSIQLNGDQWLIVNATFRRVELMRNQVRAIWFGAAGEHAFNEPLRQESASYHGAEDQVWLTTGDAIVGRLVQIKNRELTFQAAGKEIAIELGRVNAVALAGRSEEPKPQLAVGLTDGSLLYATRLSCDRGAIRVGLEGEVTLDGNDAASLCFVQPFGARVAYLSDREPLNYQHTPYLSVRWPLATDRGLTGRRLQSGDTRVLKGLAMHSAARAVYRLEPGWKRFQAIAAIDDSAGEDSPGGSVVFRVYVAQDGSFEPAFESPVVRSGDKPLPISVDITGAQAIALLADYADRGDQQDHADWLEARLVK